MGRQTDVSLPAATRVEPMNYSEVRRPHLEKACRLRGRPRRQECQFETRAAGLHASGKAAWRGSPGWSEST